LHAGELAHRLGLGTSTLSLHPKVLKGNDLIAGRREGAAAVIVTPLENLEKASR
jgi:hypothetical protein